MRCIFKSAIIIAAKICTLHFSCTLKVNVYVNKNGIKKTFKVS